MQPTSTRPSRTGRTRLVRLLCRVVAVSALAGAVGCTVTPTPYQPRDGDRYGYEETRLQERVYRITFQANRATPEGDVVDYLYLRGAELTEAAGFTHFMIEDQHVTSGEAAPSSGASFGLGMGFGSSRGGSFTGIGLGVSSGGGRGGAHRVGTLMIRMLTAEEAKAQPQAYRADAILRNLRDKIKGAGAPPS